MKTIHEAGKRSQCPGCERVLSGNVGVTCDSQAPADSVSICAYCSTMLVVQSDLSVKKMSRAEFEQLHTQTQEALLALRSRIRNHPLKPKGGT